MSAPYPSGSTQPLQTTCSNCGQVSPPGMSFCSRCGQPLAAASVYAAPPAPNSHPPQPPPRAQPYYPPPTQPVPQYQQPQYPSYQQPQMVYGAPPPPMQPQYPVYAAPMAPAKPRKSVFAGFLLALIFGPLGLFYSTAGGGIIMLITSVAVWSFYFTQVSRVSYSSSGFTSSGVSQLTVLSLGIWLGIQLICIVWSIIAVNSYNNKVSQQAMGGMGRY